MKIAMLHNFDQDLIFSLGVNVEEFLSLLRIISSELAEQHCWCTPQDHSDCIILERAVTRLVPKPRFNLQHFINKISVRQRRFRPHINRKKRYHFKRRHCSGWTFRHGDWMLQRFKGWRFSRSSRRHYGNLNPSIDENWWSTGDSRHISKKGKSSSAKMLLGSKWKRVSLQSDSDEDEPTPSSRRAIPKETVTAKQAPNAKRIVSKSTCIHGGWFIQKVDRNRGYIEELNAEEITQVQNPVSGAELKPTSSHKSDFGQIRVTPAPVSRPSFEDIVQQESTPTEIQENEQKQQSGRVAFSWAKPMPSSTHSGKSNEGLLFPWKREHEQKPDTLQQSGENSQIPFLLVKPMASSMHSGNVEQDAATPMESREHEQKPDTSQQSGENSQTPFSLVKPMASSAHGGNVKQDAATPMESQEHADTLQQSSEKSQISVSGKPTSTYSGNIKPNSTRKQSRKQDHQSLDSKKQTGGDAKNLISRVGNKPSSTHCRKVKHEATPKQCREHGKKPDPRRSGDVTQMPASTSTQGGSFEQEAATWKTQGHDQKFDSKQDEMGAKLKSSTAQIKQEATFKQTHRRM